MVFSFSGSQPKAKKAQNVVRGMRAEAAG